MLLSYLVVTMGALFGLVAVFGHAAGLDSFGYRDYGDRTDVMGTGGVVSLTAPQRAYLRIT